MSWPNHHLPSPADRDVIAVPIEHIYRSPHRSLAPTPDPAALAAWLNNPALRDRVLVRPRQPGGYELLVGEFSWRLAQAARFDTLPARVLQPVDDGLAQQLAALDADQDTARLPGTTVGAGHLPWCGRAKLAIARAMRVLRAEQRWSLTAAAELFGLSRAEGAHYLRVLTLPAPVLDLIEQGALSFGQARALSRLTAWPERARVLAHKVAALPGTPARARRRPYSVREVERLVAEILRREEAVAQAGDAGIGKCAGLTGRMAGQVKHASGDLGRTERLLTERCGFPVQIDFDPRTGHGRVMVRFASVDEFQTVAELLVPGIDFEDSCDRPLA